LNGYYNCVTIEMFTKWSREYEKRLMQQAVRHIYLLRFVIRVNVELHNLHPTWLLHQQQYAC